MPRRTKLEQMTQVLATGADTGQMPHPGGHGDLVPLDQLMSGTPGAHQITWTGKLRNGVRDR